ncbi:hypothetical protein C1646_676498 [Rhizophagus diaphanus]|nr:hypothetical protein C1646_676498 [Rhizophagus diaphanus] [Rhizophagus sp. MUCL 43196]
MLSAVNETFKNGNNKRIRIMEAVNDKEADIFIRPINVKTQSREAAPIETERMIQMAANTSLQTLTQQNNNMLVDVQETTDKNENNRLDSFEKRMDSAFLSLTNMHHTFESFMNKITLKLMQKLQIQRKPLLEMNIREFKDLVIDLFKITQIKYVEEDDLYKEEQIKYYIDK